MNPFFRLNKRGENKIMDLKTLKGNVVTRTINDKILLYYGPPGTWKTTTACGNPKTLLAAYEIGYKFIPGVKAVNMNNWHGLKDLVRQLDDPEVQELYDTVVIDTIGLAYKACISFICAREGVTQIGKIPYGQGYGMAKDEFEKLIHKIPQLGYGLIMIAHSNELDDEQNGYSVKVDVDKRPANVIKGMADFILFARKEKKDGAEEGSDETAVYAYSETSNPNIEVKSRARFFPKRILFTYDSIVKAVEDAVDKQDEFYGVKSVDEADFSVYQDQEVNLGDLQQEILSLAQIFIGTEYEENLNRILTRSLKGTRVSQTNKTHIPALYTVRDELIDLQKGM